MNKIKMISTALFSLLAPLAGYLFLNKDDTTKMFIIKTASYYTIFIILISATMLMIIKYLL
jgi:hypothetical protein